MKRQKLGFGEFRTADYHHLKNNNSNDCNTNNTTTTTIATNTTTTTNSNSTTSLNTTSLHNNNNNNDEIIWQNLENLMQISNVDYIILFRQLNTVAQLFSTYETSVMVNSLSSKDARLYIPSIFEVSMFPNIDYAVSSSSSCTGSSGSTTSGKDTQVRDEQASIREVDLISTAMGMLAPAFYRKDMVSGGVDLYYMTVLTVLY